VPVSGAIPGFLQSGDDFAIVNLPENPGKIVPRRRNVAAPPGNKVRQLPGVTE